MKIRHLQSCEPDTNIVSRYKVALITWNRATTARLLAMAGTLPRKRMEKQPVSICAVGVSGHAPASVVLTPGAAVSRQQLAGTPAGKSP